MGLGFTVMEIPTAPIPVRVLYDVNCTVVPYYTCTCAPTFAKKVTHRKTAI